MRSISTISILSLFWIAVSAFPAPAFGQSLNWNAAGTPSSSFELTDGPSPNPQPGDQVFTATNTCDSSSVRVTFGNPDGAADPGEPFVDLRDSSTIDWWIEGTRFDDAGTPQNDARMTMTLEFLGDPVENLQFDVYDVDNGSFIDEVLVSATFVSSIPVTGSCGSASSCSGSGSTTLRAIGVANAGFGSPQGTVSVTIPGPVQTVSLVYQAADTGSLNGDQLTGLSDFSFSCSTVPVTLSSFLATPRGQRTEFSWTTATETANVGFHIYGEVAGDWQRLNRKLVPSSSVDSLEPRAYRESLVSREATRFMIADVDTRGRETLHGPFDLAVLSGVPAAAEAIDWQPIRGARERRAEDRRLSRRAAVASRERQPRAASGRRTTGATAAVGYELRVSETGLYRVPFESVPGLAGVSLEEIALTQGERPVPARVVGSEESDGTFGPGAFVEFYGNAVDTLYTRTNVYRLISSAELAVRVKENRGRARRRPRASYSAEVQVEKDNVYSFAAPNGDPWYETGILAYDRPVSKRFEFEVDQLTTGRSTLKVELWGVTDWTDNHQDHHIAIALNGSPVSEHRFDGLSSQELSLPLERGVLVEGINQLEITSLGDTGSRYDLIHIDSYGARYPRRTRATSDRLSLTTMAATIRASNFSSSEIVAYRVLNKHVIHMNGVEVESAADGTFTATLPASRTRAFTYLLAAADGMRVPEIEPLPEFEPIRNTPGEYLIITHPDFEESLGRLTAARSRDGLRVKVVSTDAIYHHYSGGVFAPEAIRAFIGDSVRTLGARYVLLVGGDSYDYFDNLGIGSVSFLPTLYERTHALVNFAPVDAALADADGDHRPDVAIGRFPVRTIEELELMIDKTLSYSGASKDAVFVADASDGAVNFAAISDELASFLPNMSIETAYIDSSGVQGARDSLFRAVNAGAALTHFFGHSGPAAWTFSGLLTASDASTLRNVGDPTVAFQWGCWSGYHSVPQFDTLSHKLLLGGPQGAAAVLGAASLTEVASDRALAKRVYTHLSEPGTRIGDAIQRAKQELGSGYADVILGMTLLGDPALVID